MVYLRPSLRFTQLAAGSRGETILPDLRLITLSLRLFEEANLP